MRKLHFVYPVLFVLIVFYFFHPFLFQFKLPIPADTIVGLYHPFRDLYAKEYPRGIPFKNSLITDPVRQQYPWRTLAITLEKQFTLPLWNPYTFAGAPLLANFQTAAFYPLNFLFFIVPFPLSWSILIFLEPLLGGLFLFFYLKNLKLHPFACLLGSMSFAFSGFFVGWMEWGTLVHSALWLPLILLSIDKIIFNKQENLKLPFGIKNYNNIWSLIFVVSLLASFLAGHLQTFFYLYLAASAYFLARWLQFGKSRKVFLRFLLLTTFFLLLTSIQWVPTLQMILQSGRDVDQINNWQKAGWFIPWQHLIQFVAPDFFGNPTTLNYWGVWNYGEFIGYIGILPLILALFAFFNRHDKKTLFFGALFFLSLIFSLPTPFAKLPYILNIPFLSTSQPTRLLFITDFSLAILAALGGDVLLRHYKIQNILYALSFVGMLFLLLWMYVLFGHRYIFPDSQENISIAKHNLYIPSTILLLVTFLTAVWIFSKNKKIQTGVIVLMFLVTAFDLLHFAQKFIPFTDASYLFPKTKLITYLQGDKSQFRIMSTDSQIMPPNFSIMFHLQTVDGYDPLYLRRYGELIAASERRMPDIHPPFGFNRIITPHNYHSTIIDMLGVKYILSLSDIASPQFKKVFEEGQTKVYKNANAFPRAFFVTKVKQAANKNEAIAALFDQKINGEDTAIVEDPEKKFTQKDFVSGSVNSVKYAGNTVTLRVTNTGEGFLVLMDSFYPTWHAKICSVGGGDCRETKIYLTDYNFRGIAVPAGEHTVIFYDTLL